MEGDEAKSPRKFLIRFLLVAVPTAMVRKTAGAACRQMHEGLYVIFQICRHSMDKELSRLSEI